MSCLNGWTTGNIAGSARDLSMFYRDLFFNEPTSAASAGKTPARSALADKEDAMALVDGVTRAERANAAALLPEDLLLDMQKWRNLTNDWTDGWGDLGIYYGLALFHSGEFSRLVIPGTGDGKTTPLLGHPGGDYGSSSSPVCGYNTEYRFGLCVLMPSAQVIPVSAPAAPVPSRMLCTIIDVGSTSTMHDQFRWPLCDQFVWWCSTPAAT